MTYRVINRGEIESLKVYAVDKKGNPLTGKTDLYVRIQRGSDNWFLDWNAPQAFKAAGHTTLSALLTEIDATNAPGLYELSGGFDSGAVTNLADTEDLNVIPLQTPGTDAKLPGPSELQVRLLTSWSDAEREQLRGALGVDGTKTAAVDGQLQDIKDRIG